MAGIGDLVARLSVDSAPFTKGLGSAKGSLKSFAGGIAGILGPVAGALAVAFGAGKSISAFKEQDSAQKKLAAVIKATGGAAGLTADEIGGIASKLQDVTNFGDEATIGAASLLATFKNIKGDTFERSLVAMQDMATVMGTDVAAGAVQMGKALNDPIKGAAALADVGVGFTDAQKKTIKTMQDMGNMAGAQGVILAELEGQFGGAAKAMADPWTQAKNNVGDVAEVFGSALMPVINVASAAISSGAKFVQKYADSFVAFGESAGTTLSSVFDGINDIAASMGGFGAMADATFSFVADSWNWLQDTISYGITAALAIGEWALTNWQAIGELAFKSVALGVVSFASAVGFFFTTEMPAYLAWFSDNFGSVIFTAVDYTLTTFINLGQNIRNIWQAVLDFFSTGEFAPDWTPLLEGAHSAISKMPDIPARIVGDVEAALSQDVAALKSTLAVSFDETVGERLRTLDEMQKMDRKKPKLTKPDAVAKGGGSGGGDAAAANSKKKEAAFSGVMAQGSSEAFALLARSQRNSPQVTEQKKTNRYLKKMADKKTEPVFAPEGIG